MAPKPGLPEAYASWYTRLHTGLLEHQKRGPSNMECLWVITVICGRLGTDPHQVPRLIAYLACAEPDVVHLEELDPMCTPAWLPGHPYTVKDGPLLAMGGRTDMLHQRVVSGAQVKAHPC